MGRLALGERRVDLITGDILPDGGRLRPYELALLRRLYAACGETVPRERLLVEVWGYSHLSASRTLDTTIARLRAQLEPPAVLLTEHGAGYALRRAPPRTDGPLLGREALLERIAAWLPGGGWLTLAGPGGIGKSRLLEAIAELPRGGRPLVYVDVGEEGVDALADAVTDARRVVLADLGALPPAAIDGVDGPATVVVASRLVLDRRGETVAAVPPIGDRLPLALALAGAPDRAERLAANRASTLAMLSAAAREAWARLPELPEEALVDELTRAGLVWWRDGRCERAPWLDEAHG